MPVKENLNLNLNLNLFSIIGRKNLYAVLTIFILLFGALSYIFIEIEAFESFHAYSREHEDWELDEFFLVAISALLSISISALLATYVLSKYLLKYAREQIDTQQKLSHSRKLQSMGSLLGGISHSMNNHLLPVLTISRMIQADHPDDHELQQDIKYLIKATESAKNILRKILNFTRQEEMGEKHSCVVDESLKVALELASTAIPSSIKLHVNIPEMPVTTPISHVDFEVIVLNMITNSIDAIGSTGNIEVTLARHHDKNEDKSTGHQDFVCIAFKDDGVGMTEEQKMRIFEPFYTTKETGKGTGLGLSETYGIVKAVNGMLEVDSKIGEYSEFRVILPVVN